MNQIYNIVLIIYGVYVHDCIWPLVETLSYLMSLAFSALTLGTTINKCTRVCLATERRLYYTLGKMEDGTPCPTTEKGYKEARCAGGYCLVS